MTALKLLKDGISVDSHVYKAGDIVLVPDRRAETMVRFREAVPVSSDTPSTGRIENTMATPRTAERATAPRQK